MIQVIRENDFMTNYILLYNGGRVVSDGNSGLHTTTVSAIKPRVAIMKIKQEQGIWRD